MNINELWCNRRMMSVHKCGFFLCLRGTARILLGKEVYHLRPGCLSIYAPNTIIQILEKSADLDGVLEENVVEAYYPVVSTIDIHRRLQIRQTPCVEITPGQVEAIISIVEILRREEGSACVLHLRYALCLKVLEVYFCNKPVSAMELTREDTILNRFIVSVYENCPISAQYSSMPTSSTFRPITSHPSSGSGAGRVPCSGLSWSP